MKSREQTIRRYKRLAILQAVIIAVLAGFIYLSEPQACANVVTPSNALPQVDGYKVRRLR